MESIQVKQTGTPIMNKYLIGLLSILVSGHLQADVQIKIKDGNGLMNTVSSDGRKARIESKKMPGYAIIDFSRGKISMVDPQRKEVLQSTLAPNSGGGSADALAVSLKDKGGGQKIAGYVTRKYEVVANGQTCGTVYASDKLLQNNNVRAMFDSMRSMQRLTRDMMGRMGGLLSECQRANLQISDAMGSSGIPMRVIDDKGQLLSEVVEVDTRKNFGSDHYDIPDGLNVVSLDEKMNQAAQQTQQMMENMPDMNEMLQQMQQEGAQMTPEMQQQMDKIKQMLQQLQQQ